MTLYTWTYGAAGSGTYFTATYDASTQQFSIVCLEGSVNIDALWFSSGDKTSDGYVLSKSDNNLNMNGTNTVWADDGTVTTQKYVWDDYLKEGSATVIVAGGEPQIIDAPADFDSEIYSVLGIRATTSAGSIKWVDEHAQTQNAPVLSVDQATVSLAYDAAAGLITGADADATDADGDAVSFSLVGPVPADGSGNALFSIDTATGEVSLTAAGADQIGKIGTFGEYELTVQASDGELNSNTETITIDITSPPGHPVVQFLE